MACKKTECGCCCKILGLAHIGVFVKDIVKSIGFYSDVLGFECYHETDIQQDHGITKIAFIRCGTCEIELVQLPMHTQRRGGMIDHIALRVDDLEGVMACLAKKGIQYDTEDPVELPMVFDNGVRYIFFSGPDGERLELSQVL